MKKLVCVFLWEVWGHGNSSLVCMSLFWPGVTLFFGKGFKALSSNAFLKKGGEGSVGKGETQSKMWSNILLRENFGSMNAFDFRVELKWVFFANYIRYFSSLLYYCAFIYCYSWYLCVCFLYLGALITDLIVHGVILSDNESIPAPESLSLSWFWWWAFSLEQIRLRCSSSTLIL